MKPQQQNYITVKTGGWWCKLENKHYCSYCASADNYLGVGIINVTIKNMLTYLFITFSCYTQHNPSDYIDK